MAFAFDVLVIFDRHGTCRCQIAKAKAKNGPIDIDNLISFLKSTEIRRLALIFMNFLVQKVKLFEI